MFWFRLGVAISFAAAGAGCSDVGDSTAIPEPIDTAEDATATDGEGDESDGGVAVGIDATQNETDATHSSSTSSHIDASADQATPPDDAHAGSQPVLDARANADAVVTVKPDAETPDATVRDASIADAGGEPSDAQSAGFDATAPPDTADASAGPDAADASAGPDAADASAGPDAADASKGSDAGPSSVDAKGAPEVPCTAGGPTDCVQCDQNTSGVCTGTEAVVVQWDIDHGLLTGTVPSPTASCYECLVMADCIDSTVQGYTGLECEDVPGPVTGGSETATQACLDALNCVLGNPSTTTGPTSCANDPPPDGDGAFNCFCGSQEPDTNDCKNGAPFSSMVTTGGLGAESPNGVCAQVLLDGAGLAGTTSNNTVITDLSPSKAGINGPATALQILQCGGSNLTSGVSCPQCWR
jgi:hypothetical protein